MTEDELDELLTDCPHLFHMAEVGSWLSIREFGLLSTSALLDLYKIQGSERHVIEESQRPESTSLSLKGLGSAVVRDQKPMSDDDLRLCLEDGWTPTEWYKTLNAKVFFWLTEERLGRLLGAKAYRGKEHEVLVLDSRSLVKGNREEIWLCPINSGNTKPFPAQRGKETFRRIADYPYSVWRKKRRAGERVVELCVDQGVQNISEHIVEVRRMYGLEVKEILFSS